MYDIRLYDYEFNLIHIEHNIISVNMTLKYNGIGNFEAHFPISSNITEKAINEPYLIAVMGDDLQAVITGKQASADELVLYGKSVNWILSRRVTQKFTTYNNPGMTKNYELLAREIVKNAFSDIDNFVLSDVCGIEYEHDFWRNTANQTSDVVIDLLDNIGCGHSVYYDRINKKWIFTIYEGKENNIVISESNMNAYNSRYIEDLQNYYSSGFYEKISSESDESEWIEIVKDGDKEGIYRWEGVLYGTSLSEGKKSLNNKKWEKVIKMQTRNLKYGEDYKLGDIIRIQIELGNFKKTVSKRVSGVEIWYENNNFGEEPVFSNV